MDPLTALRKQVFKLPDCYVGLGWLLGFLFLDKLWVDKYVRYYIFGTDGKGGPVLSMKSRLSPHEAEYREARKNYYWHFRSGKYYLPVDFSFNDKLDLNELTYNNSHFNTFLDPKDLPRHHDPEGYYGNQLTPEHFYK